MRWLPLLGLLVIPAGATEPGPIPREARRDSDGDVLPDGAIARLGSRRFRDPGADRLYVLDSGHVVACFDGPAVRWWDLRTGKYLRGWAAPDDRPVRFSPDGRVAVRLCAPGLEIWDAWNGRRARTLAVDGPEIGSAAVSPDNRLVAAGTADAENQAWFRVWDVGNGEELLARRLDVPVYRLAFADAGRTLIVQTERYEAFGWDLKEKAIRWQINGCDGLLLDRTGRRLAAEIGADSKLTLFDAITGRAVPGTRTLPSDTGFGDLADLSPDGRTLLLARPSPVAWDWSQPAANQRRAFYSGEDGAAPRAGAFTPSGREVVLWVDHHLVVYDVAGRKRLTPDPVGWGLPREPDDLVWSRDGRWLFTYVQSRRELDGQWLAWDVAAGRGVPIPSALAQWAMRPGPLSLCGRRHFAAPERRGPIPRDTDGRWLPSNFSRTATFDGALLAVGRTPGEPVEVDPPPPDPGPAIIACGRPRVRRVTSPTVVETWSGRPLVTLPVPRAGRLAFAPDGRHLAVREPDGVRLYDVLTGREALARTVPAYPQGEPDLALPLGLSFSSDGSRLAVIEPGGTVLVLGVALPPDRTPLERGEADRLWADLGSPDPKVGWAAVFRLGGHPAEALRLLTRSLTPAREPDVGALLRGLDSDDFRTRQGAPRCLLDLGDAARPAVTRALAVAAGAELRHRLEALAGELGDDRPPQPEDLRRLRALVVLERIGSRAARAKVEELAGGLPGARATLGAQQVRDRLSQTGWTEVRPKE